jgi:hypothetical protein
MTKTIGNPRNCKSRRMALAMFDGSFRHPQFLDSGRNHGSKAASGAVADPVLVAACQFLDSCRRSDSLIGFAGGLFGPP